MPSRRAKTRTNARLPALAAGVVATLAGVTALTRWLVGTAALGSMLPGTASMRPSTALTFVLAGASVCLAGSGASVMSRGARRVMEACAGAAALIGFDPAPPAVTPTFPDPSSPSARKDPAIVQSAANLRTIGRAMFRFPNYYRGTFPRDFGRLYETQLVAPEPLALATFINPRGDTPLPTGLTEEEQIVFPTIRSMLSDQEREAMLNELRARRTE